MDSVTSTVTFRIRRVKGGKPKRKTPFPLRGGICHWFIHGTGVIVKASKRCPHYQGTTHYDTRKNLSTLFEG